MCELSDSKPSRVDGNFFAVMWRGWRIPNTCTVFCWPVSSKSGTYNTVYWCQRFEHIEYRFTIMMACSGVNINTVNKSFFINAFACFV